MKSKVILFLIVFLVAIAITNAQIGFNYQAVARTDAGALLNNQSMDMRIGIHQGTANGTLIWQETHAITTNSMGMFDLVVGTGTRTGGLATNFADIDWGANSFYMKVEAKPDASWVDMGTSLLQSVPLAMNAKSVGSLKSLNVQENPGHLPDDALFEVKNLDGNTVFAVYNEGVRVYVSDMPVKGSKGGFAIGGFDAAKGITNEYMRVTPDSVRVYVDKTLAKASKGGFAIGGFDAAKGPITDFLHLTPENYFIGHLAGTSITSGLYNSFLGYNAGFSTTTGNNNVFIGHESGLENTSGNWNVFIGNNTGYDNTTGFSNIMIGDGAGEFNTDGYQNVILGDWAGRFNTSGVANVFIGAESGHNNEDGSYNVFMGESSGHANTSGEDNVFIGTNTGNSNTIGNYNTFIGSNSGISNIEGEYNTFLGYQSGENTTADWNTMVGYLAGQLNSAGGSQVMVGYQAGMNNTGAYNTMVGSLAGFNSVAGRYNTYLGLVAGGDAVGDYNVFLGTWAGRFQAGDNQLIIESGLYSGSDNESHALVYGKFDTDELRFNANVGVNAAPTSNMLYVYDGTTTANDTPAILGSHNQNTTGWGIGVQGDGGFMGVRGTASVTGTGSHYGVYGYASGGSTNYGVYSSGDLGYSGSLVGPSDVKFKENIESLDDGFLDKILDLTPRSYDFKTEGDFKGMNLPKGKKYGLIAQELEVVFPELVVDAAVPAGDGSNGREVIEYKGVKYLEMVPVLIKAIQEQQAIIEALEQRIKVLENK